MHTIPLFRLLTTATLGLLLMGCTAHDPDIFAGSCAPGTPPTMCRTQYADTSAHAKQLRLADFHQRFSQAEAHVQPDVRIEVVEAPDGKGSVLRCHGPEAACQAFFERYHQQR